MIIDLLSEFRKNYRRPAIFLSRDKPSKLEHSVESLN